MGEKCSQHFWGEGSQMWKVADL